MNSIALGFGNSAARCNRSAQRLAISVTENDNALATLTAASDRAIRCRAACATTAATEVVDAVFARRVGKVSARRAPATATDAVAAARVVGIAATTASASTIICREAGD
jgi:hypothetical protein